MQYTREELIDVFNDTLNLCETKFKKESEETSNKTRVFQYREYNQAYYKYDSPAEIKVTNLDTLTAAKQYVELQKNDDDVYIGVLNFASSTNPGGGVAKGSRAQEEDLCRRTTLYPSLTQLQCFGQYYNINRLNNDNRGSDDVIYSPDVLVFKDRNYNLLEEDERFTVDVITCAAPNLRDNPLNYYNQNAAPKPLELSDSELYNIHKKRAKHILEVALYCGVSHIILGAFGCGAFKNNPEIVAKAYKDVISDPEIRNYLRVIEFAIVGNNDNYDIFKRILLDSEKKVC